jgi:hypothetical protein
MRVRGFEDLLARLSEHGYTVSAEDGRLKVRGSGPPDRELEREIVCYRERLMVYRLLADPPPWLARVLKRYRTGAVHHARLGKQDVALRVDLRCLSANVATALGRDPLDGGELSKEVERAVRLLDERGVETVAGDLVVGT